MNLPETTPDGRARRAALDRLTFEEVSPTAVVEFVSRGRCLIVGSESSALEAARRLPDTLKCLLLLPAEAEPQRAMVEGFTAIRGGRPLIRGALGDFKAGLASTAGETPLDSLLQEPGARFDLVLDLGEPPLLQQAMTPLGYYSPRDEEALDQALAELPGMVGGFEKPKYFDYDAEICAHARSGKRGCNRCLEACPAEAIVSIGEAIQVNPYLCQGGGSCATTCPTGAIRYAYPRAGDLLSVLRESLRTYHSAGGKSPVVLFYDQAAMSALSAALIEMPERILPVPVEEVGSVGLDSWLVALAFGAAGVMMVTTQRTPPQTIEVLQEQLLIGRAILTGMGLEAGSLRLFNIGQADQLGEAMTGLPESPARPAASFVPPADKRGRLRLALQQLAANAATSKRSVALPAGAPFGEIRVDAQACTLCMACVSVCPTQALQDGRGLPQLNFREWNCVQCGLCERACPENAVTLNARLLLDQEARERSRLLHEEQPLCCIACGKPFATRSMLAVLERKLAGHWMFQTEEQKRRLQMCEDCRVRDMFATEAKRGQSGPGRDS